MGRQTSRRPYASNITSSKRLADSKTNLLSPTQTLLINMFLQLLIIQPFLHRRQRNNQPGQIPVLKSPSIRPGHLLPQHQIMEVIKLLSLDNTTK